MAIDILAYVLEFLLGPLFFLLNLPELPAAIGEFAQIASALSGGEVTAVLDSFLAGEYDVAGTTLASILGTLLWIAIIAGALGEFGELGGMAELIEIFG